eukprot:11916760-Heterocapsa_arctica.AAC.1
MDAGSFFRKIWTHALILSSCLVVISVFQGGAVLESSYRSASYIAAILPACAAASFSAACFVSSSAASFSSKAF